MKMQHLIPVAFIAWIAGYFATYPSGVEQLLGMFWFCAALGVFIREFRKANTIDKRAERLAKRDAE